MAQENQKHLARPISAVKKLSGEVRLSSYYSEIKPFLFGTTSTETISADNLPSTGIHNKVTPSGITPYNSGDIIVNLEGRGKVELQRADITNEQFIADLNNNKHASDYLFPSDLVSILTSLAKKFYEFEEDFDKSKLQPFVGGDHLFLVKKWGKPQAIEKSDGTGQKELILERNIFAQDSRAKELLDAVVSAAITYEQLKKTIDHAGFIHESELKVELAKDLIPSILEDFKKYEEEIKDKNEEKFVEADKKIKEEIEKIINEDLSFFEKLLTNENLKSFESQESYYKEQKTFKLSGDNKSPGILESSEYEEFKKEAILLFLDKYADSLASEFITPLFETPKEEVGDEPTEDADQEDSGDVTDEQDDKNFTVNKDQFRQQATDDLSLLILNTFINQIEDSRFESFKETFLENNLIEKQVEELLEKIIEKTESYSRSSTFFPTQLAEDLLAQNLIDGDGLLTDAIFESQWYKDFLNKTSLPGFLTLQGGDYFEKLFESSIVPALVILEGQDRADIAPDVTESDISETSPLPAAKPGDEPPAEPQSPTAPTPSQAKGTLTPDQRQKIQYESAWMYNRAVYEMFTAYGIEASSVDPALLSKLREDSYKFASSMDSKDLDLMFGSASKRQATLLKFYPTFGNDNSAQIQDFYQKFTQDPSFQEISEVQKTNFKEFHNGMVSDQVISISSPKDHLKESLKNILDSDSPALNKNVQNTLDAMIIQYGIDQDLLTADKSGHDVIDIINDMSADKLTIIFGLSSVDKLSNEDLAKLKKTLTSYTAQRASELALHTQDASLSKGLMRLSSEEAKKLKQNDPHISAVNLQFTDDIRKSIKAHGAETVVVGMDENPSTREKKIDRINKQYGTFAPLWENLTAKEQRAVYDKFGITYNRYENKDAKLPFDVIAPYFPYFDTSSLRTLRKIKGKKRFLTEEQEKLRERYLEFAEINEQLLREQQFSEFMSAQYAAYSDEENRLLMADYLNSGEALDSYPDDEFFSRFSPRELMSADSNIRGSYELSGANKKFRKKRRFGKLRDRFKDSKLYKRFKKKLSPARKMAKSLSDAAALKAAAAAANVVLPGLGAIVFGLGKKIGGKNAAAFIGTLLSLLIARTLYALTTVGGFLGGLIGGIGGFFAGGPLGIIPGLIVGANTGVFILPQNWFNALFGGRSASATAAQTAFNTSANTAAARQAALSQTISSSSGIFFGLPIYLLAPGIATFIAMSATLYTVIIIQSAFLIPLPASYDGSGGGGGLPIMGSTACFQFAPAGTNKDIVFDDGSPTITLTSIGWDQTSIDLFKAGFSRVASNKKYISLLCKNGPITIHKFPTSPQGFWGWKTTPDELIFYGGAFSAGVKGMEYVLIHESGHIIDSRNSGLRSGFLQFKTDGSCYTYPSGCNDAEAFAEGLTLYVVYKNIIGNKNSKPPTSSGPWPFRSRYPAEYNWFKNNIFGGVEY